MFKLTQQKQDNKIEYKGLRIELDLSYDAILKCLEVLEDEVFEEEEKVVLQFRILVVDYKQYADFDLYDRGKIVIAAFESLSEGKPKGAKPPDIEPYNFTHDAERIYASFLSAYDIDLIEKQGRLDWKTFIALFSSLGEDTPIMKAIAYRLTDIPKDASKDEKERIRKLKKAYELPSHRKKREENMLKAMEAQMKKFENLK